MLKNLFFVSVIMSFCFFLVTACDKGSTKPEEPKDIQGLVAYYKLDGNVLDSSGNDNHGAAHGDIQPCQDRENTENSALIFDRIDDFIELELTNGVNKISNTSAAGATVAFWMNVNLNGLTNTDPLVLFSWPKYLLEIVPTKGFGFNTWNNDVYGVKDSLLNKFKDKWVHITAIFYNNEPEKSKLYIDGELQLLNYQGSRQGVKNNAVVGDFGRIGNNFPSSFTNNYKLKGKLDELKIYNRELAQSEIEKLQEM